MHVRKRALAIERTAVTWTVAKTLGWDGFPLQQTDKRLQSATMRSCVPVLYSYTRQGSGLDEQFQTNGGSVHNHARPSGRSQAHCGSTPIRGAPPKYQAYEDAHVSRFQGGTKATLHGGKTLTSIKLPSSTPAVQELARHS